MGCHYVDDVMDKVRAKLALTHVAADLVTLHLNPNSERINALTTLEDLFVRQGVPADTIFFVKVAPLGNHKLAKLIKPS